MVGMDDCLLATKGTIMKKSEILKRVLANLIANKNQYCTMFVCIEIARVCCTCSPRTKDEADLLAINEEDLVDWIQHLLSHNHTLAGWMTFHNPAYSDLFKSIPPDVYHAKMLKTRIAWVKWMIKHWADQGM